MTLTDWLAERRKLCGADMPEGPYFVHPVSGDVCYGNPADDRENYPLDDPNFDQLSADARTSLPKALEVIECLREAMANIIKADYIFRQDAGVIDGPCASAARAALARAEQTIGGE